ncbi:uracil phosphoribosyltransferase [Thermovibrio ammonificans]|uniref:uracil phosphoribosyltransferase n=1 Tax=Thermovibrio ammonificans (strain DSM 15698 / JCM 12110 / HB-1) TaxID=648996 RepID=E8T5R8_THEA1|nr:uracil phosphoribosyltransferase [Thermovibrio ammonificans]ADU96543.1 phosphoribosyltransferase [Thermovibrio ammonificans HB-1]
MKLIELQGTLKEELLLKLRNRNTPSGTFKEALHKLGLLLIERALNTLPVKRVKVETPVAAAEAATFSSRVTFLPVLRAGLGFLPPAVELMPNARLGFIGVKRNEETLKPFIYYAKIPITDDHYIVLDPMLATGGTARAVIELLSLRGVPQERVIFCCAVSAPEGLRALEGLNVTLITAAVDSHLNDKGFIVPGLGDAGDRYCQTEEVEVFESYGVQGNQGC